ncbi:MAG: adenylate/guanylate cyclase domain-containing protein, partial [Gemmataceae bacterium]
MNPSKSHYKIRFLLIVLMMFITIVTGGSIILVNFVLETKQAEIDVTGKLRLISEDMNNLTESFLNHVRSRTFSIGKMMESSVINFNKPEQMINVGLEMLKNQNSFASIQLIDAASGTMIFVGRDAEEKIYAKTIAKDEKTHLFQTNLHGNLTSSEPKSDMVDKNAMDPREDLYYKIFRESKTPDWTEVNPTPKNGQQFEQQTFSYVYPVSRKDVFLGIVRIEIGLRDISHHLTSQGAKIGFDGGAFMLERKTDGKIIVIGHENHVHQFHHSPRELLLASDCTDHRVLALQKILNKYNAMNLDVFNFQTTMLEKAPDENGKLWNFAWTSVFPNRRPYWIIVTTARNDLLIADAWHHILASVFILGIIMLAGIFLAITIAKKLSRPLELISADITKVGKGEISARPTDQYKILEMFNLATGIEEMKTGLLSFRKYIPSDVVNQVVHSRKTAKMFVEKKTITVFFSDLKNFTSMAESMDPDVLIGILGEHLAFCSRIIQKNQGTIDKFIGDSVMAFWNAPAPVEEHATMACKAALECQVAMNSFNKANLSK